MEERVLGDYKLIKRIGKGSLGEVYLAEHRFMKRQFAVKLLPSELAADRAFIQRFEEEVGILSTLDHPGIVKVHNVSFAEGTYFLVMECVVDDVGETTNLSKYIAGLPTPCREADLFTLLGQIAAALDYAHSRGVLHRTLKLSNVLVSKGSNGVQLKLSDMGLSKIIGVGSVLAKTFGAVTESLSIQGSGTKDGYAAEPKKLTDLQSSFMQSFAFLAPEQKRMEKTGPATDTFAFGILSYYMLFRQFPEGVFPFPSSQGWGYKANWDALIASCLQQHPEKRVEKLVPLLEEIAEKRAGTIPQSFAEGMQMAVPELVKVPTDSKPRPIIQTSKIDRPEVDLDPASVFDIDTTVRVFHPEEKEIKNIQPIQTEMVIVDGGTYWRGSNDGNRDEQPRHQIKLPTFAIDAHPVTNEQFAQFLEALGGEKDTHHNDIIRLKESRIKRASGKISVESGYGKHPVVGVTWYGAVAYAKWVGKRLPTEAEWEVASRGGIDDALYPTGDEIERSQANFFSSDTTAVMSYAPNGLDLYDMAGNVYEWCHDWYGYNYYEISVQEPESPKGPIQGVYRVLRGGCWRSLKEDLHCSRRHRNNPGTVNGTYGFRCAANVE